MLKSVAELPKNLGRAGSEVDKFTMDPGPKYVHEIALVMRDSGKELSYQGLELRTKSKSRNYLFRERKGNVKVHWSPTLRNSGKGAANLVELLANYCADQDGLLGQLHNEICKHKAEIIAKVDEMLKLAGQEKNENSFLTIVLQQDDKELYPGDLPEMRRLFLQRVKRLEEASDSKPTACCAVCNTFKPVGNKVSDVFKFATFDKPGFAYRLNEDLAWVNLPICDECFADLAAGKAALNDIFRFNFFGCNAWIIPKLLYSSDILLKSFRNRFGRLGDFSRSFESSSAAYQTLELDTMADFQDETNWMMLDFLYFRETNSEIKIDLYVEDVLPSHIKNILETKEQIETRFSPLSYSNEKREYKPQVTFSNLNWFTASRGRKFFLEYVRSILSGARVSKRPLLNGTLDLIAKNILQGFPVKDRIVDALALLEFLLELNVIEEVETVEVTRMEAASDLEQKTEEFFQEHQSFFKQPEDKAVFLLGVLTERFLYLQRKERGAEPFAKKLKGLKMTERDFQYLLPELRHKFTQYSKAYTPPAGLINLTSKYLLHAGRGWRHNSEELNFAFALGMGLSWDSPFKMDKMDKEEQIDHD